MAGSTDTEVGPLKNSDRCDFATPYSRLCLLAFLCRLRVRKSYHPYFPFTQDLLIIVPTKPHKYLRSFMHDGRNYKSFIDRRWIQY